VAPHMRPASVPDSSNLSLGPELFVDFNDAAGTGGAHPGARVG
jgi:hypothetical protein